jgi:GxxExxY protein
VEDNELTEATIGAAIEVHRELGPGLLESAYAQCLARELTLRGIDFSMEKPLPVEYKGIKLDCGYRIDLLVENRVLIELKSVERIADIHIAQLLTYMKIARVRLGLIINFNAKLLKDGIRRFVL